MSSRQEQPVFHGRAQGLFGDYPQPPLHVPENVVPPVDRELARVYGTGLYQRMQPSLDTIKQALIKLYDIPPELIDPESLADIQAGHQTIANVLDNLRTAKTVALQGNQPFYSLSFSEEREIKAIKPGRLQIDCRQERFLLEAVTDKVNNALVWIKNANEFGSAILPARQIMKVHERMASDYAEIATADRISVAVDRKGNVYMTPLHIDQQVA